MEDAVRYHDFHLTGYSVRKYGSELVLHLELPLGGDEQSHVRFADVEAYHFVHTGGAIIVDILEVPLSELLDSVWDQLAERWRLHGAIPHWDDDRMRYQAALEAESYHAWDIGSELVSVASSSQNVSRMSRMTITNRLTMRCSEPRPALMRSLCVVTSTSLQPRAVSGAVADLESR